MQTGTDSMICTMRILGNKWLDRMTRSRWEQTNNVWNLGHLILITVSRLRQCGRLFGQNATSLAYALLLLA
uniref:Uncharacterized protein n=1 Tax=Physcomitrium patens TaxID=3218 RepID=A0A2K1IUU0_PHYPA|nr:hypothetical protein PHYPA_024987 [Physcomitrium patens]